jgi:lipoprotein-anchoring transpeptidase ErfK/SrfK
MRSSIVPWLLYIAVAACAQRPSKHDETVSESVADLALGEAPLDAPDAGDWGDALKCKPIPNVTRLTQPKIVISIQGLTLRLIDEPSGYDRVFPVGVGSLQEDSSKLSFGESLTYYPVLATGRDDFALISATTSACKTWWTDPDTGEVKPVFAGLPFMPFYGAYAIHGPVDNFTAPNGGNLRRGYVSHGCVRMEAADVLEVYARTRGAAKVPVHVQREAQRSDAGSRIDAPFKWVGSECERDEDCNYAKGVCRRNAFTGRGFCSAHCDELCPDRPGQPTTFCVAAGTASDAGVCVPRSVKVNAACRPYEHLVTQKLRRFNSEVEKEACVPGSRGWIGDRCFVDTDCMSPNRCAGATPKKAGLCTQDCTQFCPDLPGYPWTFCAEGTCARRCSLASNASECGTSGTACSPRPRTSDGKVIDACVLN